MNKWLPAHWLLALAVVALCNQFSRPALGITFSSVGVYDESVTIIGSNATPNDVDTTAASSNVTLADFKTDVLNAFNADLGGVLNFDTATMTLTDAAQSFDVTYGTNQSNTLTVSLLSPTGPTHHFLTGSDANSVPISGTQYSGLNGSADGTLGFSVPLVEWGMTTLSRNGARTVNSVVITLDDASTFTFASEAIDSAGSSGHNTNGPDDTFFGYKAPAGRTIVSVAIDNSGFVRWDDMGFVVAPEPQSWILGALGLLGIARLRNRRGR